MAFAKGDKVTTNATTDWNGTRLASFVRSTTYDVIQVGGNGLDPNRIVIGIGSTVTAAVHANTLTLVSSANGTTPPATTEQTQTPDVAPKNETLESVKEPVEAKMSSEGIENELLALMRSGDANEILKYNMRLFGLPHQFTHFCDYRAYCTSEHAGSEFKYVGRKFIENIMLEAPVVTIVPGKPLYLPAAKDKRGTTHALLAASNGNLSALVADSRIQQDNNIHEKLRYYDFQNDYFTYMKYVNIMCRVAAGFLDLDTTKFGDDPDSTNYMTIDGTPFTKYDWKNYRWNSNSYTTAMGNMATATKNSLVSFVNNLKTFGANILGIGNASQQPIDITDDSDEDKSMLESLQEMLTQVNYVQFFVSADSGMSESANNNTAASKLEGILDSGSELMKEVAFLANSGGIDASEVQEYLDSGIDAINEKLTGSSEGTLGGVLGRIMSGASNVIKGDNMIFPEIYQSSSYSKQYSISVDLRAPYGNRLSYYTNVLVPLFHLLALTVPKQSTANTYSSPFIIKAYYPGVFSCNLGIVESIQIEKNANGDSWTVDGYPGDIKVTLNIKDMYSDLSITPAGDVVLFMANSSLIEYIATNCGVHLTTPQLLNRVNMFTNVVTGAINDIPQSVERAIIGSAENLITSIMGV